MKERRGEVTAEWVRERRTCVPRRKSVGKGWPTWLTGGPKYQLPIWPRNINDRPVWRNKTMKDSKAEVHNINIIRIGFWSCTEYYNISRLLLYISVFIYYYYYELERNITPWEIQNYRAVQALRYYVLLSPQPRPRFCVVLYHSSSLAGSSHRAQFRSRPGSVRTCDGPVRPT